MSEMQSSDHSVYIFHESVGNPGFSPWPSQLQAPQQELLLGPDSQAYAGSVDWPIDAPASEGQKHVSEPGLEFAGIPHMPELKGHFSQDLTLQSPDYGGYNPESEPNLDTRTTGDGPFHAESPETGEGIPIPAPSLEVAADQAVEPWSPESLPSDWMQYSPAPGPELPVWDVGDDVTIVGADHRPSIGPSERLMMDTQVSLHTTDYGKQNCVSELSAEPYGNMLTESMPWPGLGTEPFCHAAEEALEYPNDSPNVVYNLAVAGLHPQANVPQLEIGVNGPYSTIHSRKGFSNPRASQDTYPTDSDMDSHLAAPSGNVNPLGSPSNGSVLQQATMCKPGSTYTGSTRTQSEQVAVFPRYDQPAHHVRLPDRRNERRRLARAVVAGHVCPLRPLARYPCTVAGCDKRFTTTRSLVRHRRNAHSKTLIIRCHYEGCKSDFKRNDNLLKHIRQIHSGP